MVRMPDLLDTFDAVVLGAGSGGEVVAQRLAEAGWRVAAIEAGLVGGACPYVSCVPSKALLLAARLRRRASAGHPAGHVTDHEDRDLAWRDAVRRRDEAADHRDDSDAASALGDAGVTVVRGTGEVTARDAGGRGGVVSVTLTDGGTRQIAWRRALVVATGSEGTRPPIDGLGDVPTWTSEEALSCGDRPDRLVVLGGGAVGCELSQVYASFGVQVTLVETLDSLLAGEPDWAGEGLADVLRGNGVDLRLGVAAERAEPDGGGLVLHLSGGGTVAADRILVATGRHPRTDGLGLDVLGIGIEDGDPLAVDGRCRVQGPDGALDDVFAVGDVTGVAPYTHTAAYQGRIVAAHLLEHGRDADYSGVPRVLYTDPAVFAVGLTGAAAQDAGIAVRTARFDVGSTARAFVEQRAGTLEGASDGMSTPGQVELVCDADSRALVGACAVGPAADSWAAELALAVRARLSVDLLADHVRAFPTWEEALQPPAEELARG